MTQARYIYYVLYFSHYYMSSTSDHQAPDPGGCGPPPPDQGRGTHTQEGLLQLEDAVPLQRSITEHGSKGMVTSERDTSRPSGPTFTTPGASLIPGGLSGLNILAKAGTASVLAEGLTFVKRR